MLGLIAVIAPATGLYSLPYVAHDVADGKLGPSQVKQYYVFFSLFVFHGGGRNHRAAQQAD